MHFPTRHIAFWLVCLHLGAAEVNTNGVLWRQIEDWRELVATRQAPRAIAEMDGVMAGDAPWRATVMSDTNWSYAWGFLALNTYAWACEYSEQPIRAYRALANARAYMPGRAPPAPAAYYYWRWHVAMGERCAKLGRAQDARWYLQRARQGLSTNDGLYFKATAVLAGVLSRQADYAGAAALFDEIFLGRTWQRTAVWHNYIRLLFSCGRFEEGVAAIFRGARANGFSARYVERDYFIVDACRYWHFFRDLDIIEWYDFLGEKLQRIRVKPGNETLITLLINTRTRERERDRILYHTFLSNAAGAAAAVSPASCHPRVSPECTRLSVPSLQPGKACQNNPMRYTSTFFSCWLRVISCTCLTLSALILS